MNYKIVEFIPENLQEGIVYISFIYKTAIHKCCCGCGKQTVTPLDQGWDISLAERKISISPSIGNFQFPCKSHYWITNGEVIWC